MAKCSNIKILALAVAVVFSVPHVAQSHEDTQLKYRWGVIHGLPDEYKPAAFDKRHFVLTIGQQRYQFPQFLIDLIKAHASKPKISMHASWYHDGAPYMAIDFFSGKNHGYRCLFHLDDLSKISVTKDTLLPRGYRTEHVKLTGEHRKALKNGLVLKGSR